MFSQRLAAGGMGSAGPDARIIAMRVISQIPLAHEEPTPKTASHFPLRLVSHPKPLAVPRRGSVVSAMDFAALESAFLTLL
jgi:hypothetical protein